MNKKFMIFLSVISLSFAMTSCQNIVSSSQKTETSTNVDKGNINPTELYNVVKYIYTDNYTESKEESYMDAYPNIYQDKKITLSDIDEDTIHRSICARIFSDSSKTNITKEEYTKASIEMFGDKVKTNYDKMKSKIKAPVQKQYKNEYQEGMNFPFGEESHMVKSEKSNTELYLYDQFIRLYSNGQLHSSSDKKYLIVAFGEDLNFKYPSNESDWEKLNSTYGDKIKTYKHTFKQDKNGNYFWSSTEIVN